MGLRKVKYTLTLAQTKFEIPMVLLIQTANVLSFFPKPSVTIIAWKGAHRAFTAEIFLRLVKE